MSTKVERVLPVVRVYGVRRHIHALWLFHVASRVRAHAEGIELYN